MNKIILEYETGRIEIYLINESCMPFTVIRDANGLSVVGSCRLPVSEEEEKEITDFVNGT